MTFERNIPWQVKTFMNTDEGMATISTWSDVLEWLKSARKNHCAHLSPSCPSRLYISSLKSAIMRVFQHRSWRVLQIRALFIFLESRLCNIYLHTTIIIFFNMGSWVGIYEHKKMVGVLFCEARNTVMVLTVELYFLFSSICLSFPDILQQVCHFYIVLKWCNYV